MSSTYVLGKLYCTRQPYSYRGGNINTKEQLIQWFNNNDGISKGILGWATSANPYRPDAYLDVEHIAWRNTHVFIGECKGSNGTQVLDIAFLLNTNFPFEAQYEKTLLKLQELVGPYFIIGGGHTENLEIWMSYFESIEGNRSEILERIQLASELAFRMVKIASGIRHIPQINLK